MPAPPPYVVVWALFVFAWIASYLVRMAFSALMPPIIADLRLSYTGAGVLASAFFGAYALMQFPAGLLGDRFGRRRLLVIGLTAGAAASALTGATVSFATLLAARVFTGLAQGCLFSNDRAIVASVTPPARMALGQAVSFTGPGLGITLSLLVGGVLGELMSWRLAFVLLAAPSLVAAVLVGRFVPAVPPAARVPIGQRLRAVAGNGGLWRLALLGGCVMWVQYTLATWAPVLFREAGVHDLARAGLYSSFLGVGSVAGLVLGGWLADRALRAGLDQRVVVIGHLLVLAAGVAAVGVLLAGRPPIAPLTIAIAGASMAAWGIWGPSYALLGDRFAGRDLSAAFGLYNTMCALGAFVGPGLTGWVRDVSGSFAAACYVCTAVALVGIVFAAGLAPARRAAALRGHV